MIYIIVGPTGSGKSGLAVKLARYFNNAPIINADAFQIYKDMNIGTAKVEVGSDEYKLHHLLDIKSPNEEFSVKEYQTLFRDKVNELSETHKDIIVCGGTGLYIRASIYDYVFNDQIDDDTSDLDCLSNEELYSMLKQIDPKSTVKIHINNRKRVIRAISYARTSQTLKSEDIDNQKHEIIYGEDNVKIFMLNPDRETLYNKINMRVDKMINEGLVEEVKSLLNKYDLSITARQAIGYKEIISYLENEISLEDAIELIKKRTRNYAKRQLTFFKHQFKCININTFEDLIKEVSQ